MDIWQSGGVGNSDKTSGFEAALLKIRPAMALTILAVVSCVILLSGMYLPGPWLDTTGFRVLMQVSFKLAVALWQRGCGGWDCCCWW